MGTKTFSIIIKTAYENLGNTAGVELFGKTMLQWVCSAVRGEFVTVDYSDKVEIPVLIRPYLNPEAEYTVVLYSDTPLITEKTVNQAVAEAEKSGANVIKLTRGFVFKTDFIAQVDKIYTEETHYYDEEDFVTAFSYRQVALICEILRNRILNFHMERGVYIEDVATTFIGSEVVIGKNVRIAPNNIIKGNSVIADGVRLETGNNIIDSYIGKKATCVSSRINHSSVGEGSSVGPYANLREDVILGADCHVGDFVEIKKSKIGERCKMGHLAYIGNVVMGRDCNVGAGTVFANYDGKDKHTTVVGNRAFIGSQSTIVAPVTLGDGAFVAAGSVITSSVPEKALAIARARQVEKPEWKGNKYTASPESDAQILKGTNFSEENL